MVDSDNLYIVSSIGDKKLYLTDISRDNRTFILPCEITKPEKKAYNTGLLPPMNSRNSRITSDYKLYYPATNKFTPLLSTTIYYRKYLWVTYHYLFTNLLPHSAFITKDHTLVDKFLAKIGGLALIERI